MEPKEKNTDFIIMAPFDFTSFSMNSLKMAIALCRRINAKLHIVHVIKKNDTGAPRKLKVRYNKEYSVHCSKKAIKNYLSIILDNQPAISIKVHIKSGVPSDEICEMALNEKANLIVMGTHGTSGFKNNFIGRTAYNVIKNAPSHVLTIPRTFQKESFDNLLLCDRDLDGVEKNYETIRRVILKNDTQLEVVGIIDENQTIDRFRVNRLLDSLKTKFKVNEIHFFSLIHYCNYIAEKVLDISTSREPDLLVINATPYINGKALFIKTYSPKIVNRAKVPVWSFKEKYQTG